MVRRSTLISSVVIALAACPAGKPAEGPRAGRDARIEIARLEAQRGAGVEALIARATRGEPATRLLALRALGRVGGPRALAALLAALDDPAPAIASRAAGAIGVLAATTEPPPAVIEQTSSALIATLARPDVDVPEVIEAIGRAGDARALGPLAARLGGKDVAIAEAAALALGRFGRRQIALDATARAALAEATGAAHDVPVRRAAVWALGREHGLDKAGAPAADPEVVLALTAAVADSDPDTRAAAVAALAKRKLVAASGQAIEQALRDQDWRVAVEAVRAIAGEPFALDAPHKALTVALVRSWTMVAGGGTPSHAHVVLEGLRLLAPSAKQEIVPFAHARTLAADPQTVVAPIVRSWVQCLATAGFARAGDPAAFDVGALLRCGGDPLPAAARAQLFAELAGAGLGTLGQRRDGIVVLLAASDPAQRAAALEVIPSVWVGVTEAEREMLATAIIRALRSDAPVEVGAAAETVGKLVSTHLAPATTKLTTHLVERALAEPDAELAATLLGVIGTAKLALGRDACARGAAGPAFVIRVAGRDCLTALGGGTVPDPARAYEEPPAATPPAAEVADIAAVIGRRVTWQVETSRGRVSIALAPEVAPWHVAAIVGLTRRGFYDGLVFHRVVPDFVVQGGDPTGTGWGGPGFTLPAEPATRADGADFATGAVGIADAGKDSGGSQWFAMHSRAPHLEGRYTRIGEVTAGQDVIDALVIGDRIVSATVTVE
jgi:cyclophilin family peptidyl-prolyl cis-trans isomerase